MLSVSEASLFSHIRKTRFFGSASSMKFDTNVSIVIRLFG